jgi:Fur family ferric uptake transcriptional regulator
LENYKKIFEDKGYKYTTQRKAVLNIISLSQGNHLTAEEVYKVAKERIPGIGIATIYRTLQVLEEIGVIRKDYLGSGVVRYELNELDGGHSHHHMVCIKCGQILEAKEDLMEKIEALIEANYQFKVIDHSIKFIGYCKNCVLQ